MMTQISRQITVDGLDAKTIFDEFQSVKEFIAQYYTVAPKTENGDNILTREETAELLKISLPTLTDWTNRGILQSYRLGGNKVRYIEGEVRNALVPIKRYNKNK
ncbi:helix-turn-helix transcriptional regulator [Spirosoma pomorum]